MFGLGAQELLLLAVLAAIIIFGARRIGDIGKGLGEGIRNFRQALKREDPKQGSGEQEGHDKH